MGASVEVRLGCRCGHIGVGVGVGVDVKVRLGCGRGCDIYCANRNRTDIVSAVHNRMQWWPAHLLSAHVHDTARSQRDMVLIWHTWSNLSVP